MTDHLVDHLVEPGDRVLGWNPVELGDRVFDWNPGGLGDRVFDWNPGGLGDRFLGGILANRVNTVDPDWADEIFDS
jgi:hypothetical protein